MELREIGKMIRKNLLFLLALSILAAIVGAGVSILLLNKEYTASATVIVGHESGDAETAAAMTVSDYDLNIKLVNSYTVLLKSKKILSTVIDRLGLNMTDEELLKSIEIAPESETEILKISATNTSPRLAMDISNTLTKVLLEEARDVLDRENVQVFDYASLPTEPVRPNVPLNAGVSLLIGLFFGLLILFVRSSMDDTIQNTRQYAESMDVPVIGIVRRLTGNRRDEMGTVRTNFEFLCANRGIKTVLFLSAVRGEGKTGVLCALAESLAEGKSRVLVIDTDIGGTGVLKLFGITRDKGLFDFLAGEEEDAEIGRYICRAGSGVSLLPAGAKAGNGKKTSEWLESDKMRIAIAGLKERFDYILINSQPILQNADALALFSYAEGSILAIRFGFTTRELLKSAKRTMEFGGIRPLGCVISSFEKGTRSAKAQRDMLLTYSYAPRGTASRSDRYHKK